MQVSRGWIGVVIGVLGASACGDDDTMGARDAELGDGTSLTTAEVQAFDTGAEAAPDSGPSDATGAPAGAACSAEAACASGWCVPSAIGTVCVEECVSECPDRHVCVPASSETRTDPVFLCVPLEPADPDPDTGDGDATGDATGDDDGATSDPDGATGDPDASGDEDAVGADADDAAVADASSDASGDGVSDGDQDGDGIPDDEDPFPCLGFFLTVYNDGVTSGSLMLNGAEVVAPSSFPTADPIIVPLSPVAGDNVLALGGKLTGSPTDTMTLVVQDTSGKLWFYVVVVRRPGSPESQSYTFTIDAVCE